MCRLGFSLNNSRRKMSVSSNNYQYTASENGAYNGEGKKSFIVTWLLSWFLGVLGIDRFYLGKIGTGVLKLVTLGGFGIWALIDIILILCGAMRDKSGYFLVGYEQHKKMALIVTVILLVFGIGASWETFSF
jgi:TM2 domain-containing membrane protein YozV